MLTQGFKKVRNEMKDKKALAEDIRKFLKSDEGLLMTGEDWETIVKALEQEPRTGWIPVSERLPEEKYYCLCCDKDGYITIGYLSEWSKQWCFEDDEVDIDVIAWMPLPEPYKEG